MCDILFDEKIAGSLHFTPGQAYEDCDNGNRSAIHWDMVLIQRKEWGGGEVWFDGELIRKDGIFLTKELKPLNPAKPEVSRARALFQLQFFYKKLLAFAHKRASNGFV
jgi:hypothetical protein